MKKRSIKNIRVNSEVAQTLTAIIRNVKDPRVSQWASVISAVVSPDLKTAKAYVSVLGDEKSKSDTIQGLHSASGYIRRELARTLNMRNTPEIEFILDESIEYGVEMSKKIDEVTKDLRGDEDAE